MMKTTNPAHDYEKCVMADFYCRPFEFLFVANDSDEYLDLEFSDRCAKSDLRYWTLTKVKESGEWYAFLTRIVGEERQHSVQLPAKAVLALRRATLFGELSD